MANCDFLGVAQVSGTLSKRTIRTKDGIITRRVVACIRNGKQRVYWREDTPRRTPVTDNEIHARLSFASMASEVARRLANGDKRSRKEIWAEVKAERKKGAENAS